MALYGSTKLIFNSEIYFVQNYANTTGGAIHVEDATSCQDSFVNPCFFSVNISLENVSLAFIINFAGTAGNECFGGQ